MVIINVFIQTTQPLEVGKMGLQYVAKLSKDKKVPVERFVSINNYSHNNIGLDILRM